MAKEIKILVACGRGVATSTIAQEAVKEIAQRAGVNARVNKANTEKKAGGADEEGCSKVKRSRSYIRLMKCKRESI